MRITDEIYMQVWYAPLQIYDATLSIRLNNCNKIKSLIVEIDLKKQLVVN